MADKKVKDIILVVEWEGFSILDSKHVAYGQLGIFEYGFMLDDGIVSMLDFLSVVIILWLCRRLFLYLGDMLKCT